MISPINWERFLQSAYSQTEHIPTTEELLEIAWQLGYEESKKASFEPSNQKADYLVTEIKKLLDEQDFRYKQGYQQGREDAIEEFVGEMKKLYWDKELQSAKDDPCVIDAMIDLAIRIAEQIKEQKNED